MDIIFCQPVTNETISTIRERYFSLGWGQVYIEGRGDIVTGLHFKWCGEGSPTFPEVSDLGLSSPRKL